MQTTLSRLGGVFIRAVSVSVFAAPLIAPALEPLGVLGPGITTPADGMGIVLSGCASPP
jgi:hypothetical protein